MIRPNTIQMRYTVKYLAFDVFFPEFPATMQNTYDIQLNILQPIDKASSEKNSLTESINCVAVLTLSSVTKLKDIFRAMDIC